MLNLWTLVKKTKKNQKICIEKSIYYTYKSFTLLMFNVSN